MSCPQPLAPDTAICGNGGTCVPGENRCACVNGWSGRGDFVFGEPSCNIYLPAIKYMWIPALVVHLLVLPLAIDHVVRSAMKLRSVRKGSDGGRTLIRSFVFGLLMLLCNVFIAATALLKINHPDETIGTDPAVTTTFFIGAGSFWAGSTTFISLFLDMNLRNAKIRDAEMRERFAKSFNVFGRYNPIVSALTVLWMSMPMYMLAASSSEAFFGLGLCHYVGAGTTIAVYGLIMIPMVINPIRKDIRGLISGMGDARVSNTKDEARYKKLESRMGLVVKEVRNQSFINLPTALIMGCWPLLQSFSSYFLPIPWLSAGAVCCVCLLAGAPTERRSCLKAFHVVASSTAQDNTGTGTNDRSSAAQVGPPKQLEKQDSAMSAFQSSTA